MSPAYDIIGMGEEVRMVAIHFFQTRVLVSTLFRWDHF